MQQDEMMSDDCDELIHPSSPSQTSCGSRIIKRQRDQEVLEEFIYPDQKDLKMFKPNTNFDESIQPSLEESLAKRKIVSNILAQKRNDYCKRKPLPVHEIYLEIKKDIHLIGDEVIQSQFITKLEIIYSKIEVTNKESFESIIGILKYIMESTSNYQLHLVVQKLLEKITS